MSLEESRRSQRPYRYGMVLLCVGALINWLGLAENYVEPVRYVGVACIVAGALLICAAMCCWLHAPPTRTSTHTQHTNHPITAQVIHKLSIWNRIYLLHQTKLSLINSTDHLLLKIDDPIHVISIEEPPGVSRQKPPDYEAVTDAPPSYDDAIKLNPSQLIRLSNGSTPPLSSGQIIPTTISIVSPTLTPPPPYAR
ncbi:hypothetical protein ALC56_03864 [Trachymyrmex septentrionalis]|uniref:Uncharacterized protein n=1 Tax=Trachymyrmex septentrionalis TaxID=34720 RepID=A0A195FMU2_9HYME|nr:hypothetical protein ALC56_03864 [Trachymyrmex septentrionalis]